MDGALADSQSRKIQPRTAIQSWIQISNFVCLISFKPRLVSQEINPMRDSNINSKSNAVNSPSDSTELPSSQKKLEEYQQTKPEQLMTFELTKPSEKPYSNSIEFYDAIPKYYWGNQKRDEKGRLDSLKRNFVHKGTEYIVTIQPSRIEQKNCTEKDYFPSVREEIIEDALRKLACEGNGVFLDERAGVMFSLYQLKQELKRMGHGYSLDEIKEAIMICNKSNIEVKTKDGKNIISASFFMAVGLQTQEDWKGHGKKTQAFIIFNPLVTKSIQEKTFRLLNYNKSMLYKKTLARWFHKRLSHNYIQASSSDPYQINLLTIIRDSGIKQQKVLPNNIYEVEGALKEMLKSEVLAKYEIEKVCQGRKIIDAKILLVPHDSFVSEVKYANKHYRENRIKENQEESKKMLQQICGQLEHIGNPKNKKV